MSDPTEPFTFPVLVAGNTYAVYANAEALTTIPASLAKVGVYNGNWIIDSVGRGWHVKETVCAEPQRRSWNPFRKNKARVQFIFDDEAVVLTHGEIKQLLFAGFSRHSGIAGSILGGLKVRLEAAETLADVFRILSADQEAWRQTL